MAKRAADPALGRGWEKLAQQQLDRVLASSTFRQVDRLRRFLKFVVLESIAGRQDELKEYVVGTQVFGKEPSFDPRSDPVVRVQARRLRSRLVRYYVEEGQEDEILIDLPKGGYSPVFSRREVGIARRRARSAAIVSRNTARVLGFEDHSAEGNLRHFCAGLRDEIISRLSLLTNLRVLVQDSNHPDLGIQGGGEAAVIVAGSVRSAGDTVRVTVQFVDGATGCYLWSASIDGVARDVFRVQERVAAAVADKMGSQLVELSTPGSRGPGTVNLTAYNLYLQGRYHLSQRTEEGLRRAADFFEKSLAEDAEYGRAYAGLSDAYALLAHYGVLGPADVWTKVASTAASAVMLDASSAEAHTSLAHAKATQDWDWQAAEQGFRRAMALDPRYATAPHWYSTTVLVPTGRLDDAVARMQLAQSLDPVSSIIARDVATMYYYQREFDLALEQCDNAIELNPHFPPTYLTLAWVQEQRNELDESEAALERAVTLAPHSPRMSSALGRLFAITGRRRQATKILRDLEAISKERYVAPFELASLHFALGHVEESCGWLSKAIDDRNFELLAIKADPRFETLRGHVRLGPLVARVGVTAPAAVPASEEVE